MAQYGVKLFFLVHQQKFHK